MKCLRLIIVFALLAFLPTVSYAETHVPAGAIFGTWNPAGSPYYIEGNVYISIVNLLTIEPGVQVYFLPSCRFRIEGQLLAIGTPTDSILFTASDTSQGSESLDFLDTNQSPMDSSRLEYCIISYGRASTSLAPYIHGGGIYVKNSSRLVVSHCLITKCRTRDIVGVSGGQGNPGTPGGGAMSGHGGAIYLDNSAILIIENVFLDNRTGSAVGGTGGEGSPGGNAGRPFAGDGGPGGIGTSGSGGAIYNVGLIAYIAGNRFIANSTGHATGGTGGEGGYCTAEGTAYAVAGEGGSGANGVAGAGGAIFLTSGPQAEIYNSVCVDNHTGMGTGGTGGQGGWAYNDESPGRAYGGDGGTGGSGYGGNGIIFLDVGAMINYLTASENANGGGDAGQGGAGGTSSGFPGDPGLPGSAIAGIGTLYSTGGWIPVVSNSIIYGNSGQMFAGTPQVSYSCLQHLYSGPGNIVADPLFVPHTYYLSQLAAGQSVQSPCVDAGNPISNLIMGTTRSDFVLDNGVVDMGFHYGNFIPAPFLVISPHHLTFEAALGGPNLLSQTFQISNALVDSFDFQVVENVNWLSVTPESGGPVPPDTDVTVTVDITGLTAGTYSGDIVVQAPGAVGSPDTVHVVLTLGDAVLALSTDHLAFSAIPNGPNPPDQHFTIDNTGLAFLEFNLTENSDWLTVAPLSGGPVPPQCTATVSVQSITLPAGVYNADIFVTTPWGLGSPDTVQVSLTVGEAVLFATPDTLIFNTDMLANPLPQQVIVANNGQGIIEYTVQDTISWLQVTPTAGRIPSDDTLQVLLNVSGFPAGVHECDFSISSPGVMGDPQNVHVIVNIAPYISGSLKGILPTGTYHSTGDVFVQENDTLIIQPGATLLFQEQDRLDIHGTLLAVGTQQDSIIFTQDLGVAAWQGIGISSESASGSMMKFCRISGSNSGGIGIGQSNPTLSRCRISGNSQINSGGGGIRCSSGNAIIDSCVISDNIATASFAEGGGIHIGIQGGEASPMFRWCEIRNNSAISTGTESASGGGVYCMEGSSARFEHCTITNNSAVTSPSDWAVSGICCDWDSSQFINCTIQGNICIGPQNTGFAIYALASKMIMKNCIIADQADRTFYFQGTAWYVTIQYCNVYSSACPDSLFMGDVPANLGILSQTNTNGDSCDVYHNIFLDPQFVNPDSGDFHLTSTSPCIDAGDPTSPPDPDSTIADMGVFYFYHQVGVQEKPRMDIPTVFCLSPPYPNPFNPLTTISFGLPEAAQVKLTIFDVMGRQVATLVDGQRAAGMHNVTFDATGLASGVYLYKLEASGSGSEGMQSQTTPTTFIQKMVLLK